jgi:hypothetical protein
MEFGQGTPPIDPITKNKFTSNEFEVHHENCLIDLMI